MNQLPIQFSTPMVQSILAGRKTVTRRIIKPQPIDNQLIDGNFYEGNHKGYVKVDGHCDWQKQFASEFARWQPGDVLYIRETHYRFGKWVKNGQTKTGRQKWKFVADNKFENVRYQDNPPAKVQKNSHRALGWYKRSGLFMPKNLSRIWLHVNNVRPERLQDITEENAVREGIEPVPSFDSGEGVYPGQKYKNYLPDGYREVTAIDSFKSLWISINGPDSWEANPWVWRLEFETISTTGRK